MESTAGIAGALLLAAMLGPTYADAITASAYSDLVRKLNVNASIACAAMGGGSRLSERYSIESVLGSSIIAYIYNRASVSISL